MESGMEGRENDVSTTKRSADKRGRAGAEKEFKLIRFSPWPLDHDRFQRSARESSRAGSQRAGAKKFKADATHAGERIFISSTYGAARHAYDNACACMCICAHHDSRDATAHEKGYMYLALYGSILEIHKYLYPLLQRFFYVI